ncbi:MAG TPA: hypothetical protein VF257_04725 [Solirubrobacteraceae bacterium]
MSPRRDCGYPAGHTGSSRDDAAGADGHDGKDQAHVRRSRRSAMTLIQEPPQIDDEPTLESRQDAALDRLTDEVQRQGRQIKTSQQAFSIFAVLAFVLAMASLLAVAFKLDRMPMTVVKTRTPAPAAVATAPLPHNVGITLGEFSVRPNATRAAAGKVTFRVHNAGAITHEFVVIKTRRAAADLPLKQGRADEAGAVGEIGDLRSRATKSVTLKLAAGHYALICNLAGHYVAGQHTDFTVR